MHNRIFPILILAFAIFFICNTQEVPKSPSCPQGYVRSTVSGTMGTCVYGCHTDDDCNDKFTNYAFPSKCLKSTRPHWLCDCSHACLDDGICVSETYCNKY
ncbi:unnamed protein product [Rhizophagus irregularis]|nr:unnamed protein product [Rhizophagus irregularis]CAB5351623.1 unnamed protein product [Rhizophagus irregularis]